jgi:hypothetical protein
VVVTVVVTPTSALSEVVVTIPTDVDTLLFVDAGSMATGLSVVVVVTSDPVVVSTTTLIT